MEEVMHNSLGEDPDIFRNLSDNSFAHGCCEVWFTVRTGLKGGAVIHRGVDEVAGLCAPL